MQISEMENNDYNNITKHNLTNLKKILISMNNIYNVVNDQDVKLPVNTRSIIKYYNGLKFIIFSLYSNPLLVINDFGEENLPGLFVSEPMRKGHVRKFRKGFNTTHGTKISACSRLKTMIENDKMIIHSKPFITELKNYVATGSSYQAKLGQTDDLISALLLVIRIMSVLKDWDPRVYNTFKSMENEIDYEPPMPIFISTNY